MGFRKPKKAIGLDIGTHMVKAVLVSGSRRRLRLEQACCIPVDRNQLNTDPVTAQSQAVQSVLSGMPAAQSLVSASLSGQTVVVRYLRLTDISSAEIADAVAREASTTIPYDLNDVYMDWAVLDEYEEEGRKVTKVLIVAAMREVVDTRLQVLHNSGAECSVLTIDSVALADAGEACHFFSPTETVAIIDIGLTSSSIQFIKNGISNFIRDVNWGARELITAIAKTQRCSYEQAVTLIENYQRDATAVPETTVSAMDSDDLDGTDTMVEAPKKKDSSFSSPLDPLEEEDEEALISIYDTGKNTRKMPQSDIPVAVEPERGALLDEIAIGPLTRLASELRRSFDYYEHQLYEQPVDRVLLCGGLAEFPPVLQALEEELGFGVIEVASPDTGVIQVVNPKLAAPFLAHPGQFVVALGLAARGMTEL